MLEIINQLSTCLCENHDNFCKEIYYYLEKKLQHSMSAFFCVVRTAHHLKQSLSSIVISEQQYNLLNILSAVVLEQQCLNSSYVLIVVLEQQHCSALFICSCRNEMMSNFNNK